MNVLPHLQTPLLSVTNLSALYSKFQAQLIMVCSVYNFLFYSITCKHVSLLTSLLGQPITYTVSSYLATGSNHRSNSLNGMSQSHQNSLITCSAKMAKSITSAHSHIDLVNQPCKEKITTYVIVNDLLCV